MKVSTAFLLMSLALSAQATQVQTLKCTGNLTDDNGYPAGKGTFRVTLINPTAASLKKLGRAQASKRITVAYETYYDVKVTGAKIADGKLYVNAFTASEWFTVALPVEAIGERGKIRGVEANFASGGGTTSGRYVCTSSIGAN